MADERESVTVRLPKATMDRVRQIAEADSTPDQRVTASDIIRTALTAGLRQLYDVPNPRGSR